MCSPGEGRARPTRGKITAILRQDIRLVCAAYAILVVLLWVLCRIKGETWWIGAILLYGPRWALLLPLPLLLVAAAVLTRRSLWVLALAAVFLCSLTDFSIPWRRILPSREHGFPIRVLTCNTHYTELKPVELARVIAQTHPDVVALQVFGADPKFFFDPREWYIRRDDDLCLASRFPIQSARSVLPVHVGNLGTAIHYRLITPAGAVQFYSLHLISPHLAISAALRHRIGASDLIEQNSESRSDEATLIARDALESGGAVVLAGDFNLPSDSIAYRNNFSEFADGFATAGWGFGWTYRVSYTVTRIDHVLCGKRFVFRRCWVGDDVGSPHRPLVADLELMPGQ